MIIWLCGQSGAGKTTLANKFKEQPNTCFIDGDEFRKEHCKDLGYSKADRYENNLRMAKLARDYSHIYGTVIVSAITPYKDLRERIKKICHPVFIRVDHKNSKGRKDDAKFEELTAPLLFNIQV